MSVNVTKSVLIGTLGKAFIDAHNANKNNKPTEDMGGNLPGGIEGIAELRVCRIQKIAKGNDVGKLMFYAQGRVLSPKTFTDENGNTHRIAGKLTQISEYLFDTPNKSRKTVNDHIKKMYDILLKLGLPIAKLTPDLVESAIADLVKRKVTFEFRTWQPPPATEGQYNGQKQQVVHMWGDRCEWTQDNDKIQREAVTPSSNNINADNTFIPTTSDTEQTVDLVTTEGEINPELIDNSDIDSLAVRADAGDQDAQMTLQQMAIEANVNEDALKNAKSWIDVKELIVGKEEGNSTESVEETNTESNDVTFSVGDQFNYHPLDFRTKQPMVNPIVVEIVEFTADNTATLKNIANPKITFKGIGLDKLLPLG